MPPKLAKAPASLSLKDLLTQTKIACIAYLNTKPYQNYPIAKEAIYDLFARYQAAMHQPPTSRAAHIAVTYASNTLLDIITLSGHRSDQVISFGNYIFKILIRAIRSSRTQKLEHSDHYSTALPKTSKKIKLGSDSYGSDLRLGIDFHNLSAGFAFFYLLNMPKIYRIPITAGWGQHSKQENIIRKMNILRYGVICALELIYPQAKDSILGSISTLKSNPSSVIFLDQLSMPTERQLNELTSCSFVDTTIIQPPVIELSIKEPIVIHDSKPSALDVESTTVIRAEELGTASGQAISTLAVAAPAIEEKATTLPDDLEIALNDDTAIAKSASAVGLSKAQIKASNEAKQFLRPNSTKPLLSAAGFPGALFHTTADKPEKSSAAATAAVYTPKKKSSKAMQFLNSPGSVTTPFN